MAGRAEEGPATVTGLGGRDRELLDAREQAVATDEILVALGRAGADPGDILDLVIERARRLCRADAGVLALLEDGLMRYSRASGSISEGYRAHYSEHPIGLDRRSLMGRVVQDRGVQQIHDVLADPDYGRQDLQRLGGFRTVCCAPMLLDDEVVGVLMMWRTTVSPFTDTETRMLEDFAVQGAIALRQVELRRSLEARSADLAEKVDQLEALRAVGEAVGSSLDLEEVLNLIVSNAVRLTGADGGSIMEYDASSDALRVRATSGTAPELVERLRGLVISRSATLVGRVVTERQPFEVRDLESVPTDLHLDLLSQHGWRSLLAVPMARGESVVGVLVIRNHARGSFPRDTVDLLETFASQSSAAITNARLFQELESKSAELAVASRHKSEFLASMSHELRTPLNAVIGFSEVLLDRLFGDLNDRQDEYVRDIWQSGRHLLELLNEILDLSKVEAGQMVLEPARFDVSDSLDQTMSMLRERAVRHSITLRLDVADGVGTIEADPLRFKQLVLNLASNAVKFSPDGGTVLVTAWVEDDHLHVTVTDSGSGVPEEDRERIFEAFQQGGRGVTREEGTGLGLTLCRRIVELFGGRLWLDSDVGSGSTFGFAIPTAPTASDEPSPAADDTAAGPLVLLVDDDRASIELYTAYLAGTGTRVETAPDGEAGLRLAMSRLPAAVVLDIRLPRLDGWRVLANLRAHPDTFGIPVVVTTVVDDRARGMAAGAEEYLIKPVNREALLAALTRVGALPAPGAAPATTAPA